MWRRSALPASWPDEGARVPDNLRMSAAVRLLSPGEPAPHFVAPSAGNPRYHFHTVAGRHALLLFAADLQEPACARLLQGLLDHRALFDDARCSLFVLAARREDVDSGRVRDLVPGIRVLHDYEGLVRAAFGLQGVGASATALALLDPTLRLERWFPSGPDLLAQVVAGVEGLPHPARGEARLQAPVIVVPRVFEPAFCRELVGYYERQGGVDSGYMRRDADGIRGVIDHAVKRRTDCMIEDEALRRAAAARIQRRLVPEIRRVFRFDPTRMERYLVACYDASTGGYFRPHRDNDGDGHRQFAVTLNLNAEEYEGGDLRFPEYGLLTYRAPTGGACVFSCGLMHEATPVTAGKRFAFLPFLYDEASAAKREANNALYPDPAHHYFRRETAKDATTP